MVTPAARFTLPSDFVPVLKKNVCYIVAAVIFNEKNEVRPLQCLIVPS